MRGTLVPLVGAIAAGGFLSAFTPSPLGATGASTLSLLLVERVGRPPFRRRPGTDAATHPRK
jgi:hypothetical protein